MPQSLESLGLPVFDAGSGDSAAQLAAATQASPETGISIPEGNLPRPRALHSGTYSPTATKVGRENSKLEFVEASEMLPETWWPDAQEGTSAPRRLSRRSPITDILAWAECFALMAAVLAEKFPAKSPQLWAYLRRIVNAAQNYQGSAWVACDREYRRQALA